jgi:hypothetical protein
MFGGLGLLEPAMAIYWISRNRVPSNEIKEPKIVELAKEVVAELPEKKE